MPVWNHLALSANKFDPIRRKEALKCLRQNHNTHTVKDILEIADRKITCPNRPHLVNPSGIRRRDCGCPPDRIEFQCKNPGECVGMAKQLLQCIHPKFNPTVENQDLCSELVPSVSERPENGRGHEDDTILTFDPDFRLTDRTAQGPRVTAFSLPKTISSKSPRNDTGR
ncbi:hypothetical protein C8R45DRAFT_943478 [Mycena sanguinolenta]|nr:hypothetical protein C8R45DRAFT_943478 [Mycena sanguinolenta]